MSLLISGTRNGKSMKAIWCWRSNIKTISEGNCSECRWVKQKRHKKQKRDIKKIFLVEKPNISLPCKVTLTRIAPGTLDAHDNLPMSMKWIVDSIADYIIPNQAAGQADDSKLIKWEYRQEKGKPREYAVRIEIES